MTQVEHRSYSQLKTLRGCSWQYKLKYVDHLTKRPNVTAVAGTLIHTVTELIDTEIHKGNTDNARLYELAVAAFEDALPGLIEENSKHFPPEEWKRYGRATKAWPHGQDLSWFKEVGIPNAIAAYIDFRLVQHPELQLYELPNFGPAIEVPFSLYLERTPVTGEPGHVQVIGYIDRIMQADDGQLYLLDLKSGRKPESDEQLAPYRQALLETGHDIRWGGYVYALKTGEAKLTPPIDLSHWTREQMSRIYGTADWQIRRGIYIPNPGENCQHCPVAHHCEFNIAVI